MGELQDTINEEHPVYTFGALTSDIGGAMGLLLGLSVLDVLIFSSLAIRKVVNGFIAAKENMVIIKKSLALVMSIDSKLEFTQIIYTCLNSSVRRKVT